MTKYFIGYEQGLNDYVYLSSLNKSTIGVTVITEEAINFKNETIAKNVLEYVNTIVTNQDYKVLKVFLTSVSYDPSKKPDFVYNGKDQSVNISEAIANGMLTDLSGKDFGAHKDAGFPLSYTTKSVDCSKYLLIILSSSSPIKSKSINAILFSLISRISIFMLIFG